MTTERYIRLGALIAILVLYFTSQTARDYTLWAITLVAFVYAVTLLVACIVIPEEVAEWFRKRKG